MTVTELHPRADSESGQRVSRWIPTRAGILNVWRYYDEVFEFHHGRLLLRGPNGSGKSKALELLLPFLFDANLRPNRLSTFGTSERTMHWNLMGEGATGVTRVGYVWLEFTLDGDPGRSFTCGARLQASAHTTGVHPDYFTTSSRIGRPGGISLVNDAAQPLTRAALEEELGRTGSVHATAADYRAEVRSTLFPALSEQRFDALITALLQLRTPKLSQRLDPALLSTLLSRALPPLDEQEIADLAEGFERLDAQRERLNTLEEEVAVTRTLASRQQLYAQRVLRSRAAALISATTDLDNITRSAKQSEEQYRQAGTDKAAAETLIETLEGEIGEAEARQTGLTESEDYKQGRELDRLRQRAADAEQQASRLAANATTLRRQATDDADLLRAAKDRARRQAELVAAHDSDVQQAAVRSGLLSVYTELASSPQTGPENRKLLRAAIRSRLDQLTTVERALDTHGRSVDYRRSAESDLEIARGAFAEAKAKLDASVDGRAAAFTELATLVVAWASGCRELVFEDPDALVDQLESETDLLSAIDTVATGVLQQIAKTETGHEEQLATLRSEQAEAEAERSRLQLHQDIPPSAPPTRTTDRPLMHGAPLWRLVDFAPSVPESGHAAIEAALEGSGLLDAWLGPRGQIHGHDVFADPAALVPVTGRSLIDVLVPEEGAAVAPENVRQLLAAVAFDDDLRADSPAAIAADGSWRMGALTGSWSKDHPAYIGSLARDRARQRRLLDLSNRLRELQAAIVGVDNHLAILRTRRLAITAERAARPSYEGLAAASRRLTRAEADLSAADRIVRERLSAVADREAAVATALHELTRLAAEHGLPTTREGLSALSTATRTFGDQSDAWLDERDVLVASAKQVDGTTEQATRSAAIAGQRESEAAEATGQQLELAAMLEAIDSTLGVDYRQVLVEIDLTRRRLIELTAERKRANRDVAELSQRLGALQTRHQADADSRDQAASARDLAAERFRRATATTFPADSALTELAKLTAILANSDGVRATLDAARLLAAAWPTVPHAPKNLLDALDRLSESVHLSRVALSSRADLDLQADDDVQIFTAVVDGVRVGASELLRILRDDAERSRHEITDQERLLFDRTLTGDTRRHLAARIRQANELVDRMNARLDQVRTASNVAVRLVWQVAPDLPAGTRAARDLLLKDPLQLSESDRDSLHRFFRDRIEQAKADDTATSWEQQLAQVFDYTAWHRFVVKVDRANGSGWQLLTKKLHGALSGGEKAIVLHLPLFAAVAAHYQAEVTAPRVILLDEVFVGVDTTNRGQVFALLSALDLDLILTSDHEWCTYAELSGIGIHQLITGGNDGDDAVTTARFTWDGSALVPADSGD